MAHKLMGFDAYTPVNTGEIGRAPPIKKKKFNSMGDYKSASP